MSFAQMAKQKPKKTFASRFKVRPKDPPPWWNTVALGFAALVIGAIVLYFVFSRGSSADDLDAALNELPPPPVASANITDGPNAPSYGDGSANPDSIRGGSAGTSSASSNGTKTPSSSAGGTAKLNFKTLPTDFKSAVEVAVKSSKGTTKVPEGVVNLAVAGVISTQKGSWDKLPMVSQPARQTPFEDAEPQEDSFMLLNPGAPGGTTWVFSVQMVEKSGIYKPLRLIISNTKDGLKLTPPSVS